MSSLVGSLCARPTAARLRSRLRRGDDAPRRAGPPRAGLAEREPDEGGVAATEVDLRVHRRALGLAVSLGAACQAVDALVLADRADAIGFKKELKKRRVPVSDFSTLPEFMWQDQVHPGLKYYDDEAGGGAELQDGEPVFVHFDVKYKGVVVLSSRQATLLAGNRSISEEFPLAVNQVPPSYTAKPQFDTFMGLGVTVTEDVNTREKTIVNVAPTGPASAAGVVRGMKLLAVDGRPATKLSLSSVRDALGGEEGTSVALKVQFEADAPTDIDVERQQYSVRRQEAQIVVENANGLYSGEAGPVPPAALYIGVQGMKVGGKRRLIVPADVGYGEQGKLEIPPDCPQFELDVEVLRRA